MHGWIKLRQFLLKGPALFARVGEGSAVLGNLLNSLRARTESYVKNGGLDTPASERDYDFAGAHGQRRFSVYAGDAV
jgi:hypothetical protein